MEAAAKTCCSQGSRCHSPGTFHWRVQVAASGAPKDMASRLSDRTSRARQRRQLRIPGLLHIGNMAFMTACRSEHVTGGISALADEPSKVLPANQHHVHHTGSYDGSCRSSCHAHHDASRPSSPQSLQELHMAISADRSSHKCWSNCSCSTSFRATNFFASGTTRCPTFLSGKFRTHGSTHVYCSRTKTKNAKRHEVQWDGTAAVSHWSKKNHDCLPETYLLSAGDFPTLNVKPVTQLHPGCNLHQASNYQLAEVSREPQQRAQPEQLSWKSRASPRPLTSREGAIVRKPSGIESDTSSFCFRARKDLPRQPT